MYIQRKIRFQLPSLDEEQLFFEMMVVISSFIFRHNLLVLGDFSFFDKTICYIF